MATITAFAPHGKYLAYTSPDGSLKLWDSDTNELKQEYTPSSHLSSTCTCLSWNSERRQTGTPKKKKRKKSQSAEETPVDLIAMGTASGSILLYSVLRGDLQTEMSGGHNDTVNATCWHVEADSLFSCSSDQHIVEWSLSSGKIKHKWKADKGSVNSLCLCPGGRALLSAGRTIKLWSLSTKEVLKTFTGHATEVVQIVYAPTEVTSEEEEEIFESLNNTYFVTAARHDRLVNVWHVSSTSRNKNSIASLALPEEPACVQICKPSVASQPFLLATVTKSGHLVVHELVLNGRRKKPVEPSVTIQVATPGDADDLPRPLPVLAVYLCADVEQNLLLCHGNFLKPTFEKLPYKSDQSEVCLIRDDPTKTSVRIASESDVSKIKTPGTSKDVTVLAPGHMAPSRPSTEESGKKKSKRKLSSAEMSMEERLKAIAIDKPATEGAGGIPKADNMAVLLSQGLQSQDKKILNSVLQNANEKTIRTTVRRLPIPVVVPLVHELSRRMHGHAQSGHTTVKWIKAVLTVHTSYLMTFPELVDSLSALYQMMDARTAMLGKLSKLQGKLDLVVSQITTQETEEDSTGLQPMLVYQDESSDEDALVEDMVTSHSESEDNWNVSDMETNDVETDGDSSDSD